MVSRRFGCAARQSTPRRMIDNCRATAQSPCQRRRPAILLPIAGPAEVRLSASTVAAAVARTAPPASAATTDRSARPPSSLGLLHSSLQAGGRRRDRAWAARRRAKASMRAVARAGSTGCPDHGSCYRYSHHDRSRDHIGREARPLRAAEVALCEGITTHRAAASCDAPAAGKTGAARAAPTSASWGALCRGRQSRSGFGPMRGTPITGASPPPPVLSAPPPSPAPPDTEVRSADSRTTAT